jgi:glucose-6-phosphate 1-dehydrogenase
VQPCVLTIFGATGDLARRKLLPAIYDMAAQELLPDQFIVVGYGRREKPEQELRDELCEGIREFARLPFKEETWKWLESRIFYQQGAYDKAESFKALEERLAELDKEHGTQGNKMYYLATPPDEFAPIIENLGEKKGDAWRRIIIEKPFGRDLGTAHALNELLGQYFDEIDVFRIDHYLGKETVQNILALRFANTIWEALWNNRHIDHVQIVVAEKVGVGRRGGYYETSGALRDMVANHMLQLLTLVAMEAPVALDATAIRDEKVKALRAVRHMNEDDVRQNTLRGQYEGYRQEQDVDAQSQTETYVAMKLFVDNWRWAGVPFYLRHGKNLTQRTTEIVIRWKDTPSVLFNDAGDKLKSNELVLRIQPNEGFDLRTNAKVPGSGMEIRDVHMEFDYHQTFGGEPPEAYERLLHDALLGDSTLFTRRDETEVSWSISESVLRAWNKPVQNGEDAPFTYEPGSWGPKEADDFMARDGRHWHVPRSPTTKQDTARKDEKGE